MTAIITKYKIKKNISYPIKSIQLFETYNNPR